MLHTLKGYNIVLHTNPLPRQALAQPICIGAILVIEFAENSGYRPSGGRVQGPYIRTVIIKEDCMNNRMYDRDRYDDRNDYRRRYDNDNDRDWGERAGDEVRSWFGDDDAERRRRMDERRNDRYDYDDNRNYRTTSYSNYDRDTDRSNYGEYGRTYNRGLNRDYTERNMGTRQLEGYGYTDRFNSRDYDRDYDDRTYRSRGNYDSDRNDRGDRGFFERAGDEVRSWFGDDEAERRRRTDEQRDERYDSYRDNRSTGRYRSDDDDRDWW
jgi:hypothetical protein